MLPPLGTELADVLECVLLKIVCESGQLFVDLYQILQVKLHVFVKFFAFFPRLLGLSRGL